MLKATKAVPSLRAEILIELFNNACEEERVTEALRKGIIAKLPKKGDLTACSTWEDSVERTERGTFRLQKRKVLYRSNFCDSYYGRTVTRI